MTWKNNFFRQDFTSSSSSSFSFSACRCRSFWQRTKINGKLICRNTQTIHILDIAHCGPPTIFFLFHLSAFERKKITRNKIRKSAELAARAYIPSCRLIILLFATIWTFDLVDYLFVLLLFCLHRFLTTCSSVLVHRNNHYCSHICKILDTETFERFFVRFFFSFTPINQSVYPIWAHVLRYYYYYIFCFFGSHASNEITLHIQTPNINNNFTAL